MSTRTLLLYAMAGAFAFDCAVGTEADGASDARDGSALDALDVASDANDAPIDTGVDAGPMGDALPAHAVMFFTETSCPRGWAPFEMARGRYVMTTFRAAAPGTRGTPLLNGEDRIHGHTASLAFDIPAVSFAGASGSLGGFGVAAMIQTQLTVTPASSGIPYVQLLACEKVDPAVAHSVPLPTGMTIFVNGTACPSGFTQPLAAQGRLPIGLPAGGSNGATWGGAQVGPADPIRHMHRVSGSMTTMPRGVALASGCCSDGFARDGMYTAEAATDLADADLPTVHLLQCQRD